MRTNHVVAFLLVALAAAASGCAALGEVDVVSLFRGDYSSLQEEESDWQDACATNTATGYDAFLAEHPGSAHTAAARRRVDRIGSLNGNWGRLTEGMSVYEVDRLVGPLTGFGIDAIKGSKDASDVEQAPSFGGELVYSDAFCQLTFDGQGNLRKWVRE